MKVLAVLVTAQVLSVANSNMIAVALPQLSGDLGASDVQRQWIVDAFVLVFAALLVAGGVLADRYGRRRALLAGLVDLRRRLARLRAGHRPGPADRGARAAGARSAVDPAGVAVDRDGEVPGPRRARPRDRRVGRRLGLRHRRRPAARRRDRQRPRLALGVRRERAGRARASPRPRWP